MSMMSPEVNGNPPTVIKRKKKAQLSSSKSSLQDLNMPSYNYLSSNPGSFHNIHLPDVPDYYPYVTSGHMSLPTYPLNYPNPNCVYPNSHLGYLNNSKPGMPHYSNDTDEYLSLPLVNEQNEDETSKRRYSDPGLLNDSDSSTNSTIETKIIQKLTQQVSALREGNKKLSRDVLDLRREVNMLKQQQGMRHFEREYEPGMVTDLIREVRDAARVREEALLAKVRHMIEEKQVSLSHIHMVSEKNRNNDRICKLEEQLKNLTTNHTRRSEENLFSPIQNGDSSNSARQVLELEREALDLRRELQDTRARKEEAEKELQQLDKRLSNILRRNDLLNVETSEDGKTSTDAMSVTTTSSVSQVGTPRVILSGPVTDL